MNNKFYFPSTRSNVDSFYVMSLLSKASILEKKGKEIFHFELGEPKVSTPGPIINEIKKLLKLNLPGYTPSNGIEKLRSKISKFYFSKYKVDVNPNQIFITNGSSGAFLLSFITAFDSGKKVGIFSPVYPAYRNILKSLNIEVVEIYPSDKKKDLIDLKKIENYKNLDGLVISNPNNPNGQVFLQSELKYIYNFCKKNKIILIVDEIYHGIEYDKLSKSILNFGSNAFVINSFSKYFCMPGWRLGWAVVPTNLQNNFLKLSQNLFISTGNISQYSALKAFDCIDYFDKIVGSYKENKQYISGELKKIKNLQFREPKGAFYFYLNTEKFGIKSSDLSNKLLMQTGVVLTPGNDFDKKYGSDFLRLAFSGKKKNIINGIKKLVNWFENY
ncbi:MAG: 1-aminocyclopropane-1-carboxylate deaminase [Alphaproteobacteria bacterium]|nr:1-aminocyclopropane-1-carboxylate deaminase [Alphaproteobacteria bacterium]